MSGTILVVEDHDFMRMLIEQSLEDLIDEGWDIQMAPDGEQGVNAALKFRPQLILMDVMMPRVDGFEACRRIRAQGLTSPEVVILMLTARGQQPDLDRAREAGADAYITKPFDTDQLLATCRRFLETPGGDGGGRR